MEEIEFLRFLVVKLAVFCATLRGGWFDSSSWNFSNVYDANVKYQLNYRKQN